MIHPRFGKSAASEKKFKFVDQDREAEIDQLLNKISKPKRLALNKKFTHESLGDRSEQALKVGESKPSTHLHTTRSEDEQDLLNDQLSSMISALTHFDDNLKLKLHLNLELNQQD